MCSLLFTVKLLVIGLNIFYTILQSGAEPAIKSNVNSKEGANLINDKVYSNLFLRRREEQQMLLNHFRNTDNYEKKYKLLEVGLRKIFSVIRANQLILLKEKYIAEKGFPKNESTINAFALVLENTCLFGDLLVHMPDMSHLILKPMFNWKEIINWGLDFAQNFYNQVIDVKTQKMLSIVRQEVNPELRNDDYVNPYSDENLKEPPSAKRDKIKRKIRKGPQLGSGNVEL